MGLFSLVADSFTFTFTLSNTQDYIIKFKLEKDDELLGFNPKNSA
jgi:hypothetical protein